MENSRSSGCDLAFIVASDPDSIRTEKQKAAKLRKTQWWQRKISREVCTYCGKHTPAKELTMDHLVPLIRGGRSSRGNLVPACKSCNNRKKYMLPIEWDDYLRALSGVGSAEREHNG